MLVLAAGDATAIAWTDATTGVGIEADLVTVASDPHGFARTGDADVLETAIVGALQAGSG